jgi:hypothetical protein
MWTSSVPYTFLSSHLASHCGQVDSCHLGKVIRNHGTAASSAKRDMSDVINSTHDAAFVSVEASLAVSL